MKKRVFLASGVAVLSAAVLAACSSGNANKEANKPVTYAYVFSSDPSTLDYTVLEMSALNRSQVTLLTVCLKMTNMGILFHQLQKIGLFPKMV